MSMLDLSYIAPDEKQLLARFWQSVSGFFRGRSAWRAWLLGALLIATVLLQLLTQYGLNFEIAESLSLRQEPYERIVLS